ncbi:hypothetical protein [Tenacibaculum maritimum]|uniref:hypothetical protein n=1 Tax=Tenacibaculum maritimum TaxID=107401 RepID=UPI0038760CC3
MNYLSNKEGLLRAGTFFQESYGKKPSIFTKNTVIEPKQAELYVNKEITVGGGSINLLAASTDNEVGVTNFDGNKLEEGRAFAIDGISFDVTKGAKNTQPYNVDFKKALTSEQMIAFQFANLIMKQKNEIIFTLPIISILKGSENIEDPYRDLDLVLIEPKTQVKIEIEFPDGVVPATLESGEAIFVSVLLRGYETYQKR